MDRKYKGFIRLYLVDFFLLNVHEEKNFASLWKNLGDVYQAKSLVNKLFLRKKIYYLKMEDGGSMENHINSFSLLVAQLGSIGDKNDEQDCCMLLLCLLPDSWDHLVMAIGRTTYTFNMDEVVASLLSKDM